MMRILRQISLITLTISALAIMPMSSHAAEPILDAAILQPGNVDAPYPSLFHSDRAQEPIPTKDPSGDTFGAEPAVQDGVSAFFIDNNPTSSFTFDATPENGGDSVFYAAAPVEMRVIEGFTSSPIGGTITVEIVALDVTGALVAWVPAGETGPNGPFTSWRADVGSNLAVDPIDILSLNPGDTITVLTSGFTAFDLAGASIGSFALTLDSSDTTSVSGVAVVGLAGEDIAGFGLGAIQLFWEYEVIPVPVELQSLSVE